MIVMVSEFAVSVNFHCSYQLHAGLKARWCDLTKSILEVTNKDLEIAVCFMQ